MVTQRDIDIWRVESKEKIRKMYEDWRRDYLGRRAKEQNASGPKDKPPAPGY